MLAPRAAIWAKAQVHKNYSPLHHMKSQVCMNSYQDEAGYQRRRQKNEYVHNSLLLRFAPGFKSFLLPYCCRANDSVRSRML